MEYKLSSASAKGLPYENVLDKSKPSEKTYGINVLIKTEIVGQKYSGFEKNDLGFCPILKTDDINKIQSKLDSYGELYVSEKYPNY